VEVDSLSGPPRDGGGIDRHSVVSTLLLKNDILLNTLREIVSEEKEWKDTEAGRTANKKPGSVEISDHTPQEAVVGNTTNDVVSDGIGIAQPFTLFLEFPVHLGGTVKSVLVLLSAIGRISVATRRFVQIHLYRGS